MIKAEMITDSIDETGQHRMRTFKVRYPWFIHGEVMTHRMLSRNASSNRAIPLAKMLQEVRDDNLRAEPVLWGAEQKGMSPGDEIHDDETRCILGGDFAGCTPRHAAITEWRHAAKTAAKHAESLAKLRVHKSLCNRLLMPFTHANVVISGTEWDNFFGLRLQPDVDPTMKALAVAMWEAQQASIPNVLKPGEWHVPFIDDIDVSANGVPWADWDPIKVSVARCARVSYESFETGKRSTVEEDLKLYDRLISSQPIHASPSEHQATPDYKIMTNKPYNYGVFQDWKNKHEHGNLVGWRQYRKTLQGENCASLPKEYRI